jgi:predicted enzyme related to lactoylglutathione lyase
VATLVANVVIDANDIRSLGRFWADALGWLVFDERPGVINVSPTEDRAFAMTFLPVPEQKVTKNRVHIDLASTSDEHQAATVERLIGLGASHADIGQGEVPWVVLADPEGNEFCVLEPREMFMRSGTLAALVFDAADPPSLARFWSEATGWPIVSEQPWGTNLRGPETGPTIDFLKNQQPKKVKNRIHLDLWPNGDQQAEVDRLIALGARRVDIGQGSVPFVVMADPEDNEFCVLSG